MAKITQINNGDETYEIEDAHAVHKTGDEEVHGVKKFFSAIVAHVGRFLGRNDEAGALVIAGGKNNSSELYGGRIMLYGSEEANTPDGATIASGDGSFITLFGNHQGQTNKGKVVVSAQSEIELRSAVTFTEARAIKRNTDSSVLQIFGGSVNEAGDTSARLLLYGKNHADTPSMAVLRSDDPAKASVEIRSGTGNNAHKVFINAENGVVVSNALSVGGVVKGAGVSEAVLPKPGNRGTAISFTDANYFTGDGDSKTFEAQGKSGWLVVKAKAGDNVGVSASSSVDTSTEPVTVNISTAVTEAVILLDGMAKQTARTAVKNGIICATIPVAKGNTPAVTLLNCTSSFGGEEHIWFMPCDADEPSVSAQSATA